AGALDLIGELRRVLAKDEVFGPALEGQDQPAVHPSASLLDARELEPEAGEPRDCDRIRTLGDRAPAAGGNLTEVGGGLYRQLGKSLRRDGAIEPRRQHHGQIQVVEPDRFFRKGAGAGGRLEGEAGSRPPVPRVVEGVAVAREPVRPAAAGGERYGRHSDEGNT